MTSPGLIVVGSGPAGVSAAEAFRQHNKTDTVQILTDDPALPYLRPPLSKEFLRGEAEAADGELHPADWFSENGVELIHAAGADGIDVAERYVSAGGTRYPYRWLALACGAVLLVWVERSIWTSIRRLGRASDLVVLAAPAADLEDASSSGARRSASSARRRSTRSAIAMCVCCRASSPSAARSYRAV